MRSSTKAECIKPMLLACILCMTACADVAQEQSTNLASGEVCDFRRGGSANKSYCDVSIYKLIIAPERYDGKAVFTIGYLLSEGNGRYFGLAPSPQVFHSSDFLSCARVAVDAIKIEFDDQLDGLEHGIYSVEIAGDFKQVSGDWCVGVLSNATITGIRLVEKIK